ncbi:NAD(P)-dependent oxidoreductase, partial [Deinococcus pimensis]|uniref:NAD(P)-dependent oxidoreductase n=1 Tax=Deinococcus pimensis TaxID=309888 RepID=UPI0005EB8590
RGLHRARDLQRGGRWGRVDGLWTLRGRHVVVWGHGHIGKKLEAMLAPLGATVTGLRSRSTTREIDAALASADDVVLLLPDTPDTRGIVNAARLAHVRPGAWLLNLGRGSLVVTDDLVAALKDGTLGGALLDVTDPEPLPPESPLWGMENVVITPHVGSATADVLDRAADFTRGFLGDLAAGRDPGNRVDLTRGY